MDVGDTRNRGRLSAKADFRRRAVSAFAREVRTVRGELGVDWMSIWCPLDVRGCPLICARWSRLIYWKHHRLSRLQGLPIGRLEILDVLVDVPCMEAVWQTPGTCRWRIPRT